ncbi:MAG: stage II sporulation protein M [archaeon]
MVVENLIKPEWVDENPLYALILGACLTTIGIWIGAIIFTQDASIAGVLFTTISAVPFFKKILDMEETARANLQTGAEILKRNLWIIYIYGMFFIGMTLAYMFWYMILPSLMKGFIFSKQLAIFSGAPVGMLGQFSGSHMNMFMPILLNNLKVVFVCMVLSLLYGSGSILLLAWNASVLGVFIGSFGQLTSFIAFIPHTSLEFIAFFFAAISGALISILVLHEKERLQQTAERIMFDSMAMFMIALVLIVAGAFVEVLI